ncbi:MAG TPA: hypothetical protein VMV73_05780, partial [Candidatus Dormibacteraeota bacterium]|nr:hypothetical protein [Candidatus Dormibacteraeota bacterium]
TYLIPWEREPMEDACRFAWPDGLAIVAGLLAPASPTMGDQPFNIKKLDEFIASNGIARITGDYDSVNVEVHAPESLERCLLGANRAVLNINQGLTA